MSYVDGFVITMPKKNLDAYKKMAAEGCASWKKHGALSYMECMGDDMYPEHCELPFPKLTNCAEDEIVFFSFITYKDKEHRDAVNEAVMRDFEMQSAPENMPFEMKKMAFGGFETLVEF